MRSLIVRPLERKKQPKDRNDKTNSVKPIVFKIFPNVKNAHIDTGYYGHQYPFSLFAFLIDIRMTKCEQITINAKYDNNWISELWKSKGSLIKKEYNANG